MVEGEVEDYPPEWIPTEVAEEPETQPTQLGMSPTTWTTTREECWPTTAVLPIPQTPLCPSIGPTT